MRTVIIIGLVMALGIGALMANNPGNPVWGLFHRPLTVELEGAPGADSAAGRAASSQTLEIHTVLSKDAIPAILEPQLVGRLEADAQMRDDEPVLGVSLGGEHRAYSVPTLSRHEIVNDVVGGRPIAVTW